MQRNFGPGAGFDSCRTSGSASCPDEYPLAAHRQLLYQRIEVPVEMRQVFFGDILQSDRSVSCCSRLRDRNNPYSLPRGLCRIGRRNLCFPEGLVEVLLISRHSEILGRESGNRPHEPFINRADHEAGHHIVIGFKHIEFWSRSTFSRRVDRGSFYRLPNLRTRTKATRQHLPCLMKAMNSLNRECSRRATAASQPEITMARPARSRQTLMSSFVSSNESN